MSGHADVTWRHHVADRANRLLGRVGVRMVRASAAERYLLQGYTEVCYDGVTLRCDPHHAPFWSAFERKAWEPETLTILRRFLTPRSVYYDLGSWIGPTVVYAAGLCHTVCAFEPDPVAYGSLLTNITNNRLTNVRAFNLAVASVPGVAMLRSFGSSLGDSMSSLLPGAGESAAGWPVTSVTMDTILNDLSCPAPDVVKIDIEGGEFDLLPSLREQLEQWQPVLYLSLHAPYLPPDQRQPRLHALARALESYPTAIDVVDGWQAGGAAALRTSELPSSRYQDDFGSLLLLPERLRG